MSASYSNAKTVLDCGALLSYIRQTFPTASAASNTDGVNVVVTFSAALTAPQQVTLTSLIAAYVDPLVGVVDVTQVSLYNSSSTALGANALFTGTWEDVSRYASVTVSVLSNQASAASGLSVQFGLTSQASDVVKTFSVAAATAFNTTLGIPGRYMRVVYTNGATLQGSLSLQTKLSVAQTATIADASTTVDDTTMALLTRNLNMARQDRGAYVSVKADESSLLKVRQSGDTALAQIRNATPISQVHFNYNVNTDTVSTTLVTSGTVTFATGAAAVSTAALAASSATVATRRYVSCGVGRAIRVVLSCAFTAGATNSTQLCGIGGAENGLFFGYNGIAFGILVRNASVDTWIAQTAWNVDRLNGTGGSGLTVDPTRGNLYIITLDGTGFGTATFSLASTAVTVPTDYVVAHRVAFGNAGTATGLRITGGPLMAAATNTTNATALTVRVAGMAAFADGIGDHVVGRNRAVDVAKTISTITAVPVMTVLNKASYATFSNQSTIQLRSVAIACDGTKGSVILQLVDGATLTNSSYADISTNTSACQLDTSATSMTGGASLFSTAINCTSSTIFDLTPFDLRVSPGQSITVSARCSASGTSSAISCALTFREEC